MCQVQLHTFAWNVIETTRRKIFVGGYLFSKNQNAMSKITLPYRLLGER